ncbi:hypothetical protein EWM64_g3207 [Hericium alpestre]|uniref:RNA-dependent RNA polymerase n=1 Tax=Hericium alpestre TaxID=135208 RepID=A0A4Z0A3B2_9AGAM|nr:hypothetical protein EWM64_g3207 [Hericium alpestre]
MIPEGPIVTQSNRIIRRYQQEGVDVTKYFIRVAFRDEDRRSYRWDREVDMTLLFRRRVGAILKDGFELGGARFEFLAYSMSGLREHSVWFIRPFTLEGELIIAEKIRRSIGSFANTDLLKQPSKYAARLALAFTATSHYIRLTKGQWSEMPDLVGGDENQSAAANQVHTDGVGTISAELMTLVAKDSSAVQVRMLGYKGMLIRDDRLSGACVRLRPSMRKFAAHDANAANLEIVRTFERPNPAYLNRPLVMVLEDRGVDKQSLLELQEQAKRAVSSAEESLEGFLSLLQNHSLGSEYRLPFILKHCDKLVNSPAPGATKEMIPDGFLRRLARYTMHSVLRDIKYRARIPVPHSYSLVGVADEGRAYIVEGLQSEDVFTLNEGQIAACIQEFPNADPVWLEGECIISEVPSYILAMKVYAVGKPPDEKICFFRDLSNVVILPAAGDRSLASCLGGGDLDGDMYDIIIDNPSLLQPLDDEEAADYDGVGTRTLGRDCTVHDICDFVVEYINSDLLGLLSERHLTIADQSDRGTRDDDCKNLAKLCSQAVDYAKHGTAVDLVANPLPEPRRKGKPDWRRVDESDGRSSDYYESPRALGHLFRNVDLPKPEDFEQSVKDIPSALGHLSDLVSPALTLIVQGQLHNYSERSSDCEDVSTPFTRYTRDLRYIRISYTLQDGPDACLAEEEVVLGTILAWSSQTRWRTSRIADMKLQIDALVKGIRRLLLPRTEVASPEYWKEGLTKAWNAWEWRSDNAGKDGVDTFGLIVLGAVFECLERLGALPV